MFVKHRIVRSRDKGFCSTCPEFTGDEFVLEIKIIQGATWETKRLCRHCTIELAAILADYQGRFAEIFAHQAEDIPERKKNHPKRTEAAHDEQPRQEG
jgi:hypothetical protein